MLRRRLGELDPIDDLFGGYPKLPVQIGIGAFFFVAAWLTRNFVDLFSTGAGPFSLIFPAIMISTLYGRWQAGLVTFVLAYLHAWYFVLPFPNSFLFEDPSDQPRTIVNGSAALVILYFAEVFRSAVRRATAERDRELGTQTLLMKELEHRTKNNFAIVSSLLSMQQRKSTSEEVRLALREAATRVQSFAAIHQTIYSSDRYSSDINLSRYLEPLIAQLERGLFENGRVRIGLRSDPVEVSRDRAVAFALIVNELVTNAAKHAFPDDRQGVISVDYSQPPQGPWRLSVADDGCGIDLAAAPSETGGSGLGRVLLSSFATTAGGTIEIEERAVGTCVSLVQGTDAR